MPASVLVAGASRGIGAAIATGFARDGAARVVLVGRTAADLERVAHDVRRHGARADVVVADLTDVAAARAAVSGAGRLDAVVVNAGTNQPEPFAAVTPETFDRLFGLNVRAAFFVAQAAAGALGRGGCIAFVSSQMGHVGAADRTVYCATKHAVEGLVKALAVELAPAGIRVVSVAPTFVRTPLTAPWLDDPETGPRLLAQIPLGHYGEPDDVADAVVWACSERARMVTGTSLVVDGGWTAR
jgi:NAD(P)-dependent dehydrogenase (short-subunit alcohol dehydrogenase family)